MIAFSSPNFLSFSSFSTNFPLHSLPHNFSIPSKVSGFHHRRCTSVALPAADADSSRKLRPDLTPLPLPPLIPASLAPPHTTALQVPTPAKSSTVRSTLGCWEFHS
ncbi:hypothetical protein Csa_009672 [Cucumis sativus]|uniref:Uncharacterized protein n=1 Tax=Cucumis sativus TaxID=3659 RepID=A0A0A0L5F8_CUCSA|nr:hypothetical protein Csa_009672 [Cucumis sativus]